VDTQGFNDMIPLPPEIERVEKDLLARKITGDEASDIQNKIKQSKA
jgi:hypothetical protein